MLSLAERIDSAIQKNQTIKVRAYALLPETEKDLNLIILRLLNKYNKLDLTATLYTCIKELAVNGAKANIKRILFDEVKIDLENESDYRRGLEIFREKLTDKFINEYAQKAKDRGLFVDIKFEYDDTKLIVEVLNNSALTKREDERIRDKFRDGLKYENIGELYMDMQDNSEGAGMGIALILMMLKSENIDPHFFTIYSDYSNKTIAKITFPMTPAFQDSRADFKK
ncbi:MAG: hypothetical protein J0L53_02600 [Spirochaetes bacterium]|nr:hypothetical protein [Spirochaetota bacterium]MBX3723770.1 hypothetical protein [Turneriella sp.]